jgi:sugar phosphate isomerase/epimerase
MKFMSVKFLHLNQTVMPLHLLCILFLLIGFQIKSQNINDSTDRPQKLKTSLNAYSFNEPLSNGTMQLDDLLEFCAKTGFDAVDITAYYFPGYPNVPSDEYLYLIKRKAFQLGLEISGTGVRNDFVHPDKAVRDASVQLVKDWIVAAEKMGIPVIRIFAGHLDSSNICNNVVLDNLCESIRECIEFGSSHGVVVAIQNHWDYIQTSKQTIQIMEQINSEWFGLILDIGSYRSANPYAEIKETIPYAVSWQIKENMYVDGVEGKTDLLKVMQLIKDSGYRGYIPIETLGEGNPAVKVEQFYLEILQAIEVAGIE